MHLIKTYRRDNAGVLHYLECWEDRTTLFIHEGRVGTKGRTRTRTARHRRYPDNPTMAALVAEFRARAATEGYRELTDDERGLLVVQILLTGDGLSDGLGDGADALVVEDLPDALDDYVGWRGVGHCDGNDLGNGKVNLFLPVADTALGVRVVRRFLTGFGAPQPVLIATREPAAVDPDADYVVAWARRKADRATFSLF